MSNATNAQQGKWEVWKQYRLMSVVERRPLHKKEEAGSEPISTAIGAPCD